MAKRLGSPIARRRKGDQMSVFFPDAPFNVRITVRPVRGVPEVVGIAIEPLSRGALDEAFEKMGEPREDDAVITSELLRRLPLKELKQMFFGEGVDDAFAPFQGPRRVGNAPLSREFLDHVSDVYRKALAEGGHPLKAVEKDCDVSRAAASKYVRRAREAGLLAWPDRPGRAGASSPVSPISGSTTAHKGDE